MFNEMFNGFYQTLDFTSFGFLLEQIFNYNERNNVRSYFVLF